VVVVDQTWMVMFWTFKLLVLLIGLWFWSTTTIEQAPVFVLAVKVAEPPEPTSMVVVPEGAGAGVVLVELVVEQPPAINRPRQATKPSDNKLKRFIFSSFLPFLKADKL
jgi:hypothetical protein